MSLQFRKYTKEQLIDAVATSGSIRQVLIKLKVKSYGGNYRICKKYIKELNLSTIHFHGQGWAKGKQLFYKIRPIEDYLTNKKYIAPLKLKQRLLRDKILPYKCHNCDNIMWLNEPIPLELHHKDGNHENNNLTNIELLCPNCHSLTDTYRRQKSSLRNP